MKLGYVVRELVTQSEDRGELLSPISRISIAAALLIQPTTASFLTPLKLTMTEIPLGIICVSLPACFSLLRHVGRSGVTSLFRSYTSSEARSRQGNVKFARRIPSDTSHSYNDSFSRLDTSHGRATTEENQFFMDELNRHDPRAKAAFAKRPQSNPPEPLTETGIHVRKDISVQETV